MSDVTLAGWLLEQIAEDAAAAQEVVDAGAFPSYPAGLHMSELDYCARFDPGRVLAECEARRRIVALHRIKVWDHDGSHSCFTCGMDIVPPEHGVFVREGDYWPCMTLRLLALPYADQPGYDESWRP